MSPITRKAKIMMMFCLLPQFASAVTTAGYSCPDKFIGEIKEVQEAPKPHHALSKNKVRLKVIEAIEGELGEEVEVEVLKFGHHLFVLGEKYEVHLNDGKICKLHSSTHSH